MGLTYCCITHNDNQFDDKIETHEGDFFDNSSKKKN